VNAGRFREGMGAVAVVGITVLCLSVSMCARRLLMPLEDLSVDLRMRGRLRLVSSAARADTRELVLLAIDQVTEERLGRFGSGAWLSRGPFLDQLQFFRTYCAPSVVAYDIIFKDTQGRAHRDSERISETSARTARIADELTQLSARRVDCVSDAVLSDLSRLALEQGDIVLAHGFAGVWEDARFTSVLGFNFRGGWVDPQAVTIPIWSDANAATGQMAEVTGIPYLRELAIPEGCIHFASEAARSGYAYSPNATLPTPDLWDYVYMGGA